MSDLTAAKYRAAVIKISELHNRDGRPVLGWELEAEAAVAAAVRLGRWAQGRRHTPPGESEFDPRDAIEPHSVLDLDGGVGL